IYETDSQSALARRYGEGLVLGLSIKQINDWPVAIAKVTAEDIKRVAAQYLDIRSSVTGTLLPVPAEAESDAAHPSATVNKSSRSATMNAMPPKRRGAPLAAKLVANMLLLAVAASALVFVSSRAEAMKIQEVKSPGGVTAWLVEEHGIP